MRNRIFYLFFSSFFIITILYSPHWVCAAEKDCPTLVDLDATRSNFVSFLNRLHPGNRIGYRLHEHLPIAWGHIPETNDVAGLNQDKANQLQQDFASRPGVYIHERKVREEGWAPQDWTYYFVPVQDGFELLWVIETHEKGVNEFYSVQQCFRMSGETNIDWRREIAETPAFSEYDLWAQQTAESNEKTSLSYVRRNGTWEVLPAIDQHVVCRTPLGLELDKKRSGGNLDKITGLEPYGPSLFEPDVDCGLATRVNQEGTWVCALYWDRTTHITNHHPADCIHSFVNLGPIPPQGKRSIRGKIYWMESSKRELYSKWQDEFAN